jgi:hypothetical protein
VAENETGTHHRVFASASIAKLATALAAAQGEMANATKDSTNPHFKSKYADLASVREACRPLSKHGIAILQPTSAEGTSVTVTTMLVHTSGEWIAEDLTMTAGQNTPQAIGSAITYGRRYGLAAMVGIAPEDDDGQAASSRVPEVTRAEQPKPEPVPPKFGEWWADMQAVADEGKTALEAAWQQSDRTLRKYLLDHHREKWEATKARAAKVEEPITA